MRFIILALTVSFSMTTKSHPLAIAKLLENSDKVAICQTNNESLSLVNFYVHKVNPLIVAHLNSNNQDHFYSLTMKENKELITLASDKEIIALDFDLFFKSIDNKFAITFNKETIDNPEIKHFFTTLHFENGTAIAIHCQRERYAVPF